MFLNQKDLESHLRGELQEEITRGDKAIAEAAIDGAIAEAKGYLGMYDTEAIFGTKEGDRHSLLLIFVKDIAVYHLINMTSPGTHYEHRQRRYDRAVAWLKGVQKGDITPDLPRKEDPSGQSGLVYHSSNPKRVQHF